MRRIYYYPFGMGMEGSWEQVTSDPKNDYLYNGKERESDLGLDWDHYGLRMYDASIGRFTGVDPIADQFAHLSGYNYGSNNPINNIDLHGLQGLDFNTLQDFMNDVEEDGFFSAVSNYIGFNSGASVDEVMSKVKPISDPIDKVTEQVNDKIIETAELAGASGEVVETTGDVMMVSGIVITPFAPGFGIPLAEAGVVVSNVGVTAQVTGSLAKGEYDEAAKKVVVETVPGAMGAPLKKVIDKMEKTDQVTKEILKGQVSKGELLLEQGVDAILNNN